MMNDSNITQYANLRFHVSFSRDVGRSPWTFDGLLECNMGFIFIVQAMMVTLNWATLLWYWIVLK